MRDLSMGELVKLTGNGLDTPSAGEIRNAIITKYRSTYGNDIDTSTGTADGIFIDDITQCIYGIIQCLENMYNNVNINNARGLYLDALCNLSNVHRKQPSYSTTSLNVTNNGSSAITLTEGDNVTFVDKNGLAWRQYGASVTIAANTTSTVLVKCETIGKISAPIGWIYACSTDPSLTVNQPNVAIEGDELESDSDLRSRQSKSNGMIGTSTLSALVGGLLELSGIQDVKVTVNNTSSSTMDPKDSTTIPAFSVYIMIRYKNGVTVDNAIVGTRIYNKITPGLGTTTATNSYNVVPKVGSTNINQLTTTINWRVVTDVHPTIVYTLTPTAYFSNDEVVDFGQKLIEYLNKRPIGENINRDDLYVYAMNNMPKYKGTNMFSTTPTNITIGTNPSYSNQNHGYNYSSAVVASSGNNYTLTIS